MIVLLDTTVFGADPMCGGDAWQVLVLAAPAWGIRVAVTEVVVTEAVANYKCEVEDVREALEGWAKKKRAGALGLGEAFNAADHALSARVADYNARLLENLRASSIEVLPIADIPHMELVERATARRRPCDDKGDGYRDSLNWLTILALVQAEPKEQVIWVSDNTRDFGADSEDNSLVLHPHLIEDLESISAQERITWKLKLPDVVLMLAAQHAPGVESDIKQIQRKVRNESVLSFLARELLPSAVEQPADPRQCALPLESISAKFRSLEGIRNLELTVKGLVPEGRAVAEFTAEVNAGIDVTLAYPANVSGADAVPATRYISKPLLLRGLVTLGRYENPTGAELAAIEALPDDPARSEWQAYRSGYYLHTEAVRQLYDSMRPLQESQEAVRKLAETMRPFQQGQEAVRKLAETMRPFQQSQEAIRQLYDSMRPLQESQEAVRKLAETMRPFQQSQEAIRKLAETMRPLQQGQEAIRRLIEGVEGQTAHHESAEQESDDGEADGEEDKGD